MNSNAGGDRSHAEGWSTTASGNSSHAQNYGTKASSDNQTAIGKYNAEDANDTYALIIGNGTSDSDRSNALAVAWNGLVDVAGETAYPLFVWDSTHVSPESYSGTYPVSPCFVYYIPNNGLYYCTDN